MRVSTRITKIAYPTFNTHCLHVTVHKQCLVTFPRWDLMVYLLTHNCLIHKHRGSTSFSAGSWLYPYQIMRCHVNTGTPGKQIPVLGRDPRRETCDQRAVDLSHTNTCWETHRSVSTDPRPCFGSSWTLIGWWARAVSSPSLTIYLMTHMAKYDALSSTHTHCLSDLEWHTAAVSV